MCKCAQEKDGLACWNCVHMCWECFHATPPKTCYIFKYINIYIYIIKMYHCFVPENSDVENVVQICLMLFQKKKRLSKKWSTQKLVKQKGGLEKDVKGGQ